MSGAPSPRAQVDFVEVPVHKINGLRAVLRDREAELLLLKGPCSSSACRLHYAHSGPCDLPKDLP